MNKTRIKKKAHKIALEASFSENQVWKLDVLLIQDWIILSYNTFEVNIWYNDTYCLYSSWLGIEPNGGTQIRSIDIAHKSLFANRRNFNFHARQIEWRRYWWLSLYRFRNTRSESHMDHGRKKSSVWLRFLVSTVSRYTCCKWMERA